MKVIANMAVLCFHSECGLSVLVAVLMCFFEMGPSPLNHFFFLVVCLFLWLYFFFLHLLQRAHLLDNTEKLERSSRRLQAGYQIAVETGMYYVLDWVRMEWWGGGVGGFKIVVGMSERQQIVLLICVVGGYVCLGGSEKTLSLTHDDIFGNTSKVSRGWGVYRRQIGCRFSLLCSQRKCVHCTVCWVGGDVFIYLFIFLFFPSFFLRKQTWCL